ncbi:MAG TPA: PIG-L family deacetylase [Sedimentisphaerales bacterium]|nr:PIG-L family deacetylase [Sedimentisphaerales bacterium]
MAHPDDAEFTCTGTLALLAAKGWAVHTATMTAGDCGSAKQPPEQISKVRRGEAADAAKLLGGSYHCLECDDIFIMYDRNTLVKAIRLIRHVKPQIVFAPSPCDYMVDHETTSRIVQTACFSAGMVNIETPGAPAFEPVPYLYYVDAFEGKDIFGKQILPDILVDISPVMSVKEQMLCCHKSQRDWLLKHHGVDRYVEFMKDMSRTRGAQIGKGFAEGFRQHLGNAFAKDNILKRELGDLVHSK